MTDEVLHNESAGVGSTESANSEGAGLAGTEAERQRDEYLDALQRLKAEFDNFRKRAQRDQADLVSRAS